jgi:hypothetical protein
MRIDNVLVRTAGPLLVNGIEDVITRSDLADRSISPTHGCSRSGNSGDDVQNLSQCAGSPATSSRNGGGSGPHLLSVVAARASGILRQKQEKRTIISWYIMVFLEPSSASADKSKLELISASQYR